MYTLREIEYESRCERKREQEREKKKETRTLPTCSMQNVMTRICVFFGDKYIYTYIYVYLRPAENETKREKGFQHFESSSPSGK